MTILEKIFATKREEISAAKKLISPEELQNNALQINDRRGFLNALRKSTSKPALIAEVKKASPSMGEIYTGDFIPEDIAKQYERAGAACISVLTDVDYFKGHPSYLARVREAVQLPLLRKDFICDAYQLDEAIVWGADCVLLIVAGLEKEQLIELYEESKHRNLDVLVEVHDEAETEIAVELGAELIGINNRDLRTFKTDLSTTSRLIKMIPDHIVKVSESALESAENVREVSSYGADAVLIGTAFCGSSNIEAKVREVMSV